MSKYKLPVKVIVIKNNALVRSSANNLSWKPNLNTESSRSLPISLPSRGPMARRDLPLSGRRMLKALYMDCKGWPRCLELLMWIVKLALRRPYTFVVMVILMLVFGVAAIIEMSVAERCLVYSVGIDVHHDGAVLAALW